MHMPYLHQIDPIALDLGTWNLPLLGSVHPQVHWYGLMYLLGFMVAWWLGRRRVRAGRLPGVDDNGFGDLMFYAMLGVVLGGRFGYVLFYGFADFVKDPLMLFKVWEGGMSFHGGLLGVRGNPAHEKAMADHGIGVSMLCPGAVNSNIHEAVLTRPAHLQSTGY